MKKPKGEWRDISSGNLGWKELIYVDPDTSEVLSKITNYDRKQGWYVWKNGAGHGEFMNFEAASKKAEEVA